MRSLMASLALLAVPAALSAQAVPIRFSFDPAPAAVGDAGTVIARRQQLRAWQDTVQVYLEQGASQANLRFVGPNDTANYKVSIAPLPINKPGANGVAMAVVIFEPAGSSDWKYVAHFVAYNETARDAAVALLSQTVQSISAARARAAR